MPAATWLLSLALLAGPQVEVGDPVTPFVLTDMNFLPRELSELGPAAAYVLIFSTTGCPIAARYTPRLIELEAEYGPRGARFAWIDVGADPLLEVAAHRVEQGIGFPVFKDFDGAAVAATGVSRTPEVAVLDADHRLRYRGRVDDQYRLGGARPKPSREDLKDALDALLDGRDVKRASTPVDGCRITVNPSSVRRSRDVTWADDAAEILHRQCVDCHRPNGAAPFSLVTFDDAARRVDMIAEVVAQGRMPPWYASEKYGEFPNHRGLDPDELDVLLAWSEAGAPAGDLKRAPPPPTLPEGDWEIGEPDLIVRQLTSTELPADGYVPYEYIMMPYVFLADTWVSAVEIRSDNEPVLHHANLAYLQVGDGYKPDHFITGKVPGGDAMVLDAGTAVLIPAGSVLGLQVHFVTTGSPEKAKLSVGLRYARGKVDKRVRHHQITNTRFEIPPHARDHEVRAAKRFNQEIIGLGMFSHMHLRGRDMKFVAHCPEREPETLLLIPSYNFDWQMSYRFPKAQRRFPAGTKIEVIAHFDNSAFNPYNPDPNAAVRFGLQTYHEMMYGFFFYMLADESLGLEVDPKTGRAVDS